MLDRIGSVGAAPPPPAPAATPDPATIASQLAASPAPHAAVVAAIDRATPLATPVAQGALAQLRDTVSAASPRPVDKPDEGDGGLIDNLRSALGIGDAYGIIDKIIAFVREAAKPLPLGISSLLGPEAAAIVKLSPTLTGQLAALEKDGWTVQYGASGAGTFASGDTKTITIDPNGKGDPTGLVRSLSHEVGHASDTRPIDTSSSSKYVHSRLSREGEATLNNIQVQREILAAGGPDIGISGDPKNHAAYDAAYDAYVRSGDRAAARDAIGQVYGNDERTSNTGQTYNDYYLAAFRSLYPGRP
jgi:hypothetical protein